MTSEHGYNLRLYITSLALLNLNEKKLKFPTSSDQSDYEKMKNDAQTKYARPTLKY